MTSPTEAAIARAFWEARERAPWSFESTCIIDRAAEFDAESPAGPARGSEEITMQNREINKGEVLVEVHGLTGSGKSAVAGEIEILCKALGLEVRWENGDEEKFLTHADWTSALEMYKPRVRIVEINTPYPALLAQHETAGKNAAAGTSLADMFTINESPCIPKGMIVASQGGEIKGIIHSIPTEPANNPPGLVQCSRCPALMPPGLSCKGNPPDDPCPLRKPL